MPEVIPAVIVKNFEEVQERIRLIESYVDWVQLDIADGDFVPNQTWNNPEDLKAGDFSVFLEAHLMISEPEKYIDEWIKAGVKRIIAHIEAIGEEESHTKKEPAYHLINDMKQRCHQNGVAFGIAINPETPVDILDPVIGSVDSVLFMTVSTGFGGQEFREDVLPKISSLRKKYPNIKIEVDGGINPKTGKKCVAAGTDILVAGSYIFGSHDVKKAIDGLKNIETHG